MKKIRGETRKTTIQTKKEKKGKRSTTGKRYRQYTQSKSRINGIWTAINNESERQGKQKLV